MYVTELKASDDTRGKSGKSLTDMTDLRRNSMLSADGAMIELTDGTGGTFFHKSNDLDVGLTGLTETPETLCMLELLLENVKLGGYHSLKVKVDREAGRYRRFALPYAQAKRDQIGAELWTCALSVYTHPSSQHRRVPLY